MCKRKKRVKTVNNLSRKPTIGLDFCDHDMTSFAGQWYIAQLVRAFGIDVALDDVINVKKRKRGASDKSMLLALLYSLSGGDGAISDVDFLMSDTARTSILGIDETVKSKRLGEYLRRFDEERLFRLSHIVREVAKRLVCEADWSAFLVNGYVPVFLDGTAVEVTGKNFEKTGVGYNGEEQYWLHNIFIGGVWAGQRLFPGGVGVTKGWRDLLSYADEMIDEKIKEKGHPKNKNGEEVKAKKYIRADNAYYQQHLVNLLQRTDWHYTISLTNRKNKQPLFRELEHVYEWDWEPVDAKKREEYVWVSHQPAEWNERQLYIAIRTFWDGDQRLMYPRYSFILTNIEDLSTPEIIRMHRGKQGQENEMKGPLIDLDLHHPSSESFMANRVIYTIGQLAQILIRCVQYLALPKSFWKKQLRTIIRQVVRLPGIIVKHAGKKTLKLSKWMNNIVALSKAADKMENLLAQKKAPSVRFFNY